jgi:hypothetical protein
MAVEYTSKEGSQASEQLRVPKKRSKESKRSKENPTPPSKSSVSSTTLTPQPQLGGNKPAGLKTTGLTTEFMPSAASRTTTGDQAMASGNQYRRFGDDPHDPHN